MANRKICNGDHYTLAIIIVLYVTVQGYMLSYTSAIWLKVDKLSMYCILSSKVLKNIFIAAVDTFVTDLACLNIIIAFSCAVLKVALIITSNISITSHNNPCFQCKIAIMNFLV